MDSLGLRFPDSGIAVCFFCRHAAWAVALFIVLLITPESTFSQGEESTGQRYVLREKSSGSYEQYEVRPRGRQPLLKVPGLTPGGTFTYSPVAADVRIRSRLKDSHRGIRFYGARRCEDCHEAQADNLHVVRGNITCRQCHGDEPISSINYYYSRLNPIRRHAYLCAKCHEGAGISYASYIIHEPPAGSPLAQAKFPALYYLSWFMLVLLVGTLAFFVPHSFMVGIRELVVRVRKSGTGK
jgi:hypothetical protein